MHTTRHFARPSREQDHSSHSLTNLSAYCYVGPMRLVDCIAQCHEPFIVRDNVDGRLTTLNNTADFSASIACCPLRYVLTDDLVRLCADLAYSKGARAVACADLLRAPAATLWVEWSNEA